MKKTLLGLILIVIILLNGISVMAVELKSIEAKIEVPTEYYNLKAGVDSNDAKVILYEKLLGTTKEELKNQYNQNGIIYNGINSNYSKELIVATIENTKTKSDFHLSSLKDEDIEKIKQELLDAATGLENQSQETYENNSIKYIVTVFKSGTTTIYQYYTIVNGKAITITLNSKYSNVKQDELKTIIDTIQFNEILEKPAGITSNPYLLIGIAIVVAIVIIIAIIFIGKSHKK